MVYRVDVTDTRPLKEILDEVTEDRLRAALKASKGSVTVTAETLGVTRQTVYSMMRRYGIEIERVIA